MTAIYEWAVEELDPEGGEDPDILGVSHFGTFEGARRESESCRGPTQIALVRDVFRGGDLDDRTWAYITGEKLPEFFRDAAGVEATRVPKRFHEEVSRESSQ